MSEYKKRPDYKNTIFIITGDHKLGVMPHRSKIDVYHVPLLIYSPLLTNSSYIKAVNTHLDIVPSLLAMLKHNYNIKTPNNVHWLGDELNLSEVFTSNKNALFMLNNRNVEDAIFNNYYVSKSIYNGIFPCFFDGRLCSLFFKTSSPLIIIILVSFGSIIPSSHNLAEQNIASPSSRY